MGKVVKRKRKPGEEKRMTEKQRLNTDNTESPSKRIPSAGGSNPWLEVTAWPHYIRSVTCCVCPSQPAALIFKSL